MYSHTGSALLKIYRKCLQEILCNYSKSEKLKKTPKTRNGFIQTISPLSRKLNEIEKKQLHYGVKFVLLPCTETF